LAITLEARVTRKLTLHIIPFVMLLYFVSFLDRVNVGFAALTMNKAVGLTAEQFGFGGGLFFIGYVLCEIPSNLILKRVGARFWIARIMITWGLVSAATAFVSGPTSFYVSRLLLGVAEAGFFPGIILYLSQWFPARQRAVATAWFITAVPISTALGSIISASIMQMPPVFHLADWQLLYLIEAAPAVFLGFMVVRYLRDTPAEACWLAAEERAWLVSTLESETRASRAESNHIDSTFHALRDVRVLMLAVIYFGTSAALYVLALWAPQIIHDMGFTVMQTGVMTALPGILSVAIMIIWARHSDRTQERTWHVVIPCLVACLGCALAGQARTGTIAVLALVLISVGINSAKPPLWAIPTRFLSGFGAAAGIGMINSLGNLGGFVGPYVIGGLKRATATYSAGFYVVGASLAISAVATLLLDRGRHKPIARAGASP
jgi:ACS family tartrate transporter-like MFS transporter